MVEYGRSEAGSWVIVVRVFGGEVSMIFGSGISG